MDYLRLGKLVCQKINQNLSHVSTTRLNRLVDNVSMKNPKILGEYYQLSSYDYSNALRALQTISSNKDSKILGILSWFNKKALPSMNSAREAYSFPGLTNFEKMEFNIRQLINRRMGNCQENAVAATTILKMNGVKNACVASLKHGDSYIDHVVSVFNKDGSLFDGKIINNKTIIVDPWLGITDLANNYFAKCRSLLSDFVHIPKDGKISLHRINHLNIDESEMLLARKKFSNLVFK